MRLEQEGAELSAGAAVACLPLLEEQFGHVGRLPGVRLRNASDLHPVLSSAGAIGRIAAARLGPRARPVRAVMFDKSPDANWAVGWHQDRTIAVRERVEAPGFGPWSRKDGTQHVEPPWGVMEAMLTLRVHLDETGANNAPLLISPASHRLGRLPVGAISSAVARCGASTCLAAAGDVWIYRTPVLHASERAHEPLRRRVLQIDYCAADLPGGLEWAGV